MKQTLWRWLTHNIGWKLLSVAMSFLLWMTVVGQPDMTTLQALPVLYRNLRPDLALVPGAPEVVHVELRGTASALSRTNLAEAMVLLDLNGLDQASNPTFTLSANEVHLPQGVAFVRSTPATIAVKLTPVQPKTENRN
jgi:YbbR-like protein